MTKQYYFPEWELLKLLKLKDIFCLKIVQTILNLKRYITYHVISEGKVFIQYTTLLTARITTLTVRPELAKFRRLGYFLNAPAIFL